MEKGDITRVLQELEAGDSSASERLLPLVYDELRALAGSYLKGQQPGHTLQPTALVHELYLKLASNEGTPKNRTHFMAVAATAMRRILINHARDKAAEKRGGGAQKVTLDDASVPPQGGGQAIDLLALDQALDRLRELSERQARIVELRSFGGLTIAETAEVLNVGTTTVEDDWRMARAWLGRELKGSGA